MKKKNNHDLYVSKLVKRVRPWGFEHLETFKHYEAGECDIFGIRNGEMYYFEVKACKKARMRAVEQLDRWKEYNKGHRVHGYFYVGSKDYLERIF